MTWKEALKHKWPFFLLIGVLVGASYVGIVQMKTNPKEEEKVNVFLSSYGVNKDKLLSSWKQNKGEHIQQINLSFYFSTSSDLGYLFTKQKESMDTFLLPSSFLKTLDQEMLSRDFISLPAIDNGYQINGLFYGETAYSSEKKTGVLSDLITYTKENAPEEDYYIFYRRGSLHTKTLQNGVDDEAYKLWREE